MKTITNKDFINTMIDLLADCKARGLIYKADYAITHRADPRNKDARDDYFENRKYVCERETAYLEVISRMVSPDDYTTAADIRYAAKERAHDTAAALLIGKVYGVRNSAEAVKAELEATRI